MHRENLPLPLPVTDAIREGLRWTVECWRHFWVMHGYRPNVKVPINGTRNSMYSCVLTRPAITLTVVVQRTVRSSRFMTSSRYISRWNAVALTKLRSVAVRTYVFDRSCCGTDLRLWQDLLHFLCKIIAYIRNSHHLLSRSIMFSSVSHSRPRYPAG